MPGDRRRFAVAYLCSIFIHAIALLALVVFVLRALIEGREERCHWTGLELIDTVKGQAPPTMATTFPMRPTVRCSKAARLPEWRRATGSGVGSS